MRAEMTLDLEITEILARGSCGESAVADALFPKVYAQLRALARRQCARESAHTLQTTALVHEAYLTLMRQGEVAFADRGHLYAYMSRVMRHILIDRARRRNAQKRQLPGPAGIETDADGVDVLAVDQALNHLAALDRRLARVAELRVFGELSNAEIAEIAGVGVRTIERDWLKARTFLSACLAAET